MGAFRCHQRGHHRHRAGPRAQGKRGDPPRRPHGTRADVGQARPHAPGHARGGPHARSARRADQLRVQGGGGGGRGEPPSRPAGRAPSPARGGKDGGRGRHRGRFRSPRGRTRVLSDASSRTHRGRGPHADRGPRPHCRVHEPSRVDRLDGGAPRDRGPEPFDEAHQVGSSTMAQKRNPMLSENVTSLARLVRAFALPPLENMVQWHERDLANSANERIVLPHAIVLTDDLLTKLIEVFRGLRVDAARMADELARSGGGAMTENLMLALTSKGLARSTAHELLRTLTSDAAKGPPLVERVKAHPAVRAHLSPAEVESLLDPSTYVLAAAAKTDRILAELDRRLAR